MTDVVNKGKFLSEKQIEVIVAIMLGITALFSAGASWIASLHGGNQATNYALSNNLAAEGNSDYVQGMQLFTMDAMHWNEINGMMVEEKFNPTDDGKFEERIGYVLKNCANQDFADAVVWAMGESTDDNFVSPFDKEGFIDTYFADANAKLAESQKALEEGQKDNANGDAYNLVTVIFTVVLFLLGITGTFKALPNREILVIVSVVGFIAAVIYMCTIPLPTGFSLANFF